MYSKPLIPQFPRAMKWKLQVAATLHTFLLTEQLHADDASYTYLQSIYIKIDISHMFVSKTNETL